MHIIISHGGADTPSLGFTKVPTGIKLVFFSPAGRPISSHRVWSVLRSRGEISPSEELPPGHILPNYQLTGRPEDNKHFSNQIKNAVKKTDVVIAVGHGFNGSNVTIPAGTLCTDTAGCIASWDTNKGLHACNGIFSHLQKFAAEAASKALTVYVMICRVESSASDVERFLAMLTPMPKPTNGPDPDLEAGRLVTQWLEKLKNYPQSTTLWHNKVLTSDERNLLATDKRVQEWRSIEHMRTIIKVTPNLAFGEFLTYSSPKRSLLMGGKSALSRENSKIAAWCADASTEIGQFILDRWSIVGKLKKTSPRDFYRWFDSLEKTQSDIVLEVEFNGDLGELSWHRAEYGHESHPSGKELVKLLATSPELTKEIRAANFARGRSMALRLEYRAHLKKSVKKLLENDAKSTLLAQLIESVK